MSHINYSFELHDFQEALSPYGTIETRSPTKTTSVIDDFTLGEHFRTAADENGQLCLQLEDRILTMLIDESGSMTWNDNKADRYIFYKRLLTKLENTYPGVINTNLIGFGGVPTTTTLFIAQAGADFLTAEGFNFNQFLQRTFQDSVFDFAGVRVVRRTDRFPTHPADGVVVAEGIFEAVKDDDLTESQVYYYGVWTFNKDKHFSVGQFIKGTPFDRILPQGVNFATATPRILPGVERDVNTKLIYNFIEGSGFLTFDSSGAGRHGTIGDQVIEENFWAGDAATNTFQGGQLKKPSGVRFDGQFDVIDANAGEPLAFKGTSLSGGRGLTINFWVFRYDVTETTWILGTSRDVPSNDVGWAIGIDTSGVIHVSLGSSVESSFDVDSSGGTGVIPEKEWTMVTVTITPVTGATGAEVRFYIDGVIQAGVPTLGAGRQTLDTSEFTKLYIGAKPEDSASTWFGRDYFGSLAQISISDSIRGAEYITSLFTTETPIFQQPLNTSANDPPDNRQREVLLSWIIGANFDFSGGSVRLVRKYLDVPAHEDDGTTVSTVAASAGQFFFMDSFDFINNGDYYYRIFTFNTLDNACDRLEARILPIHIKASTNDDPVPPLSPVSDETVIEGNKKLFLEWINPTDSSWVGTKLYFGTERFPTVSVSPQGDLEVSDGDIVKDTTNESFVHRIASQSCTGSDIPLANGQAHYYTLVTYDRLGNISEPRHLFGVPSVSLNLVFPSEEVRDLHLVILNPRTLSVQWENPTIKTNRLDLYFGESALAFVSVKDAFGGSLDDITNLRLQVCTAIRERGLLTTEQELGVDGGLGGFDEGFNPRLPCGEGGGTLIGGGGEVGGRFGNLFDENCNDEKETAETVITYATVESGLIKGLITHTTDRDTLSRREKYTMDLRAQYKVEDPDAEESEEPLFVFNTSPATVTFTHPVKITAINKLRKFLNLGCEFDGGQRSLDDICTCNEFLNRSPCDTISFNGGYINANQPYVCRVELQFKGESLPDGTPVNVRLFKHGDNANRNPLTDRSDRTFIREGLYNTIALLEEELDNEGNPTGKLISKSIVDIEIPHPALPDYVDLYVTLDYLGFFVEAVHEIRFISSLFIRLDVTKPAPDGIDVAEQFATVWIVNPDNPNDPDANLPVPDGTLVKWNLEKLRHAKERPFYSTEQLGVLISGVYSTTTSGIARNVFFGPVGNIERHFENLVCSNNGTVVAAEICCLGEEYAISASVILSEETAIDSVKFAYACEEEQFTNRKFLVNAAANQPGSNPHWITWADGIHLIRFQIAKNPAISQMFGAECFRQCAEAQVGGQLFQFANDQIIQITAPAEILWNVVFSEDPYTGELTPVEFDSISPSIAETLGIPFVANIPISGEPTDFYLRLNAFIGDGGNPKPDDCEGGSGGGGGLGGGGIGADPCQWVNLCDGISICTPTTGRKWINVATLEGVTTLIAQNKEVSLFGGGDYDNGIPPVYVGFKEPLDVRIIEARIGAERVSELIVDSVSQHTFIVEVTFTGDPVPDGTQVEVNVEGESQDIIILSSCAGSPAGCNPASNGIIFTRQINDPLINPSGAKRSLSFFTIEPIPDIAFSAKINVTCRFDKLGTVEREIVRCIELSNTVNEVPPDVPPGSENDPIVEAATSNEAIVYDTVRDLYELVPSGQIRRMGHFAAATVAGTADFMYVFSGYTGAGESTTASVTPLSEIFNIVTQKWEFTTDIPTPRAYGMTVTKDDKIYCIGGVELDQLLSQHTISRKIESFDTGTELWNSSLAPMPDGNGIAYGNAEVIGNSIYVTCGITSIVDNSKPGDLNTKILRYSIPDDKWVTITPSNTELYGRLAAFGFFRSNPKNVPSGDSISDYQHFYIYGGSIPKDPGDIEAERTARVNELLDQFRSFLLTSAYFQNLTLEEQEAFISEKEEEIRNGVLIPAFVYPVTGFKFRGGSEFLAEGTLTMDISDSLDDEWVVLPLPRDHGRAVYIPNQDVAYFLGGSNQNKSTTLNKVESIDLANGNLYSSLTALSRGRAMFGAVDIADDIYITGGLTSGHKEGWVQIEILQMPEFVQALGTQSGGLLITLKNDAGEIIEEDIRVDIHGRLRMPEIDDVLIEYQANRAADRALGGDGSGNAPDLPGEGEQLDIGKLIKAQNKIIDPNSDQFQFNAARKLNEEVTLFPILYSALEPIIEDGLGGVNLLPRSEDPFDDFKKLSEFIGTLIDNTPPDPDERFQGDLTREELAALGDVLLTIKLPPTIIDSGALRELYQIETIATVLDSFFFGQTVSDFDLNIQERIQGRIKDLLTPPPPPDGGAGNNQGGVGLGGGEVETDCFVLQHSAQPDIPPPDNPPGQNDPNNPAGTGGFSQSGQCLFCESIFPLNVDIRDQLPTPLTTFFNITDWIPQIKKRLITNTSSIPDALEELDIIDHEVPFGSSQLYNAMIEAARISTGDELDLTKKVIYIASDNSQNLSLVTRQDAIDSVNAIDGDKKVPVIYTVFSTAFPLSISALLARAETGDVVKITEETRGQSLTLTASGFMDQILNFALGSATGGLGYGIYRNKIDFTEVSAITAMTLAFILPTNTQGFVRFRHSEDGFNFGDFSERFEGAGVVDFIDFFARFIEYEVVLATGFTEQISEEYDTISTGLPKLTSITWEISGERDDFMFLDSEGVLKNVQQISMAFEGSVPKSSIIELGVATSNTHNWNDFHSPARPVVREFGKSFLLERDKDFDSVVAVEPLVSIDGYLYKANYGAWDPEARVDLFTVDAENNDIPVLSGFRLYPREGEVYFRTRQSPTRVFKLTIVNRDKVRVGMRLRNRLHSESITIEGIGYIYSTNDEKPTELAQVAPRAVNVFISPTNPTAADSFFALYEYIDLNNDPQFGTILSWFRNGSQLFEIQNRASWVNTDLLLSHRLEPGDTIQFSVTPSDGKDFGTTVFSPVVAVVPRQPGADDVRIVPIRNLIINDRFDTSSTFRVEYDFQTDDVGIGSVENGTIIKWFVNGLLFKEDTFTEGERTTGGTAEGLDPKELAPNELSGGQSAHLIGNQISAEVTPNTLTITGITVRSQTITVENSIPIANNVQIQPLIPNVQSTLTLTFEIDDLDITLAIQTDQSEIKWFSSANGRDFAEVEDLRQETTAPPFFLRGGEHWYSEVTPFDGLDLGITKRSNIVIIQV